MRAITELVVVPLLISVASELIAEWLIRKYFEKRDKK